MSEDCEMSRAYNQRGFNKRNHTTINYYIPRQQARRYNAYTKAETRKLIDEEKLKELVKDYIDKEKKQEKERREEPKIIDCSNYGWEDFERKFEEIEDDMEIDDEMATNDDYDYTMYTDAWDPRRIFEFCMIYWDELNVEESGIRRDNVDIIAFSAYYCAVAELFLSGQESIEGVDGHTRDSIQWAKHQLKKIKIPEFIGDMLLGLRPIVLREERARVVLLPHQQVMIDNEELDHIINYVEEEGVRIANLRYREALIVKKVNFEDVQEPYFFENEHSPIRMNWMKEILELLDGRAPGPYEPRHLNRILQYNHLIKRYSECTLCANLHYPIHFTRFWFDFWLSINVNSVIDKWAAKLFYGFGNEFMYQPRFKEHIPYQAIDVDQSMIVWREESIREQWIPWIVATSRVELAHIAGQVRGEYAGLSLNKVLSRNNSYVMRIEYARRLAMLVRGATKALSDKPP